MSTSYNPTSKDPNYHINVEISQEYITNWTQTLNLLSESPVFYPLQWLSPNNDFLSVAMTVLEQQ